PGEVGDGLPQLGFEPSADELAVEDPHLAGDDEPLARPDDGCVRTYGLAHAGQSRIGPGSARLTATWRRWASRWGSPASARPRRRRRRTRRRRPAPGSRSPAGSRP